MYIEKSGRSCAQKLNPQRDMWVSKQYAAGGRYVLTGRGTPAFHKWQPGGGDLTTGKNAGPLPALSGRGGPDPQFNAVFCHGSTGQLDAVAGEELAELVVAEGMLGILGFDQSQQFLLDCLTGGALSPYRAAEKIPQRIGPLAALEVFAPGRPRDGRGMETQDT